MHTQNLFINKCNQRHVIKALVELLPQSYFVPSFYFIKEAINPSNSLSFMVTPEYYHLLWISNFKGKYETNYFGALSTSIDIVSHEKVLYLF